LLINFYEWVKYPNDDKLRKGPMFTKLTRPQPTRLPCVVWYFKHFTNFSKSQRPSQS